MGPVLRLLADPLRSSWRAFVASALVVPLLYLAALGFGIGTLVDAVEGWDGVSYAEFVAPGLLASSAMLTASTAATFHVMWAVRWGRSYHAQLATPLRVVDVLVGHTASIAFRVAVAAVGFWVAMLVCGLTELPRSVLLVPAAVLTGLAFAGPFMAVTVGLTSDQPLTLIVRLVILPLFFLSGIFSPVSQYPPPAQVLVALTPLWHGVELCRALSVDPALVPGGRSVPTMVGHVAVLLAYAGVGTLCAARRYRRALT